jgi:hypothetical protein
MRNTIASLTAIALTTPGGRAQAPVPLMILDGESAGPYHDWARVTPVLEKILGETGLFATTVVTAPQAGGDFTSFVPAFEKYRTVVSATAAHLKDRAFDRAALAARPLPYERLDQMLVDVLLGAE